MLKILKKRMNLIAYVFLKLKTVKEVVRPVLKSPVSKHPSTVIMLKYSKHC